MSTPSGHQPRPVGHGRGLQALGGVLALASCVAMLPGAVATLLTTIGIQATTGPLAPLAQGLAHIARPLLIAAVLLLLVGSLRCGAGQRSWQPWAARCCTSACTCCRTPAALAWVAWPR
jgi:hypothetical protein